MLLDDYISHIEKVFAPKNKKPKEVKPERLFALQGFDTKALLEKNEQKHTDKYNYLIHYLHMSRVLNQKYENNEFIPLNQKVFSEYVTKRKAKAIIDFWLQYNVIECDEAAKKGVKSLGYRLTEDYVGVPIVDTGIVDTVFEERLRLLRIRNNEKLDLNTPQHRFLHWCLHEVRIDATDATRRLIRAAFNARKCIPANATAKEARNIAKANAKLESKLLRNCTAIHLIQDRAFRIKRDTTGKRVHHNVATLNRHSRQSIYLENGNKLWNSDVKNSQPLIMCLLLLKEYQNRDMPACMLKYIDDCERGVLYDELMKALQLPEDTDRVGLKKRVFKAVFYGENKHAKRYPEWIAFSKLFPSVATFITACKRKNYQQLAINMQRAESEIIIDGVIAQLAGKYLPQDFFALTIHDSVICEAHNVGEVVALITQAFNKRGLNPTIESKAL
ncbi:hypothetical protein Q5H92_24685 [Hymenobacter sp. M29]|uniref:DNA-directed DNA polymerase family A palm domain-containing protein n=1 Tax=Hymenobacter mellowenesis TaxID=3063995 RepID=A0ABT9AI86_9BACT|nr:hypothetical protein [Hymenobacter sp. M29]MDO7849582.1 hypothetical protein [Hymenobacter sp. M29]